MSKIRWLQIVVALAVLFGAGFLLLGQDPVLSGERTRDWLTQHGPWAAGVSIALLAGDIFLPVPSSVVMTLNGQLFGLAGGAGVSFAGSMLAWIGCYWLGRLFGWGVAKKKDDAADPVAGRLRRYGVLLLIATRPVPILAELTAATAGVARMGWWRFLAGAAAGTAPICLLYAWVGWRSNDLADSFVALAVAVGLPLILWAAIARPWLTRGRQG